MDIPRDLLVKLLADACRAPSGDNIQPWRFRYAGGVLFLYNVPGVHNPELDFEERGAYIAHGALLENLSIAAPQYGLAVAYELFPDDGDADLVARVRFAPAPQADDPLYDAVRTRATNRRFYASTPLEDAARGALRAALAAIPDISYALIEGQEERRALARAASRSEVVILEDDAASGHFFDGMVWTSEDERTRKEGFFVKTMEFNPVERFVFGLASVPRIMRVFRALGLPRFIAHEDAKRYGSGSVMGGVALPDDSAESFVRAGRALERVWLAATREGLAFQPLISTAFIAHKELSGRSALAERHAVEMREALADAKHALNLPEGVLAFVFRAGKARAPSYYTSRRDPVIVFE